MQAYFFSLIAALGLKILPFPFFWAQFNPDWVLLILIYWTLVIPEKTGVFSAWMVGILVDVLTGRLLGEYALTYGIICYFCLKFHRRLRLFPLPQQILFIFGCLLMSRLLVFWIESIQNLAVFSFSFWLPVLTGSLCWPLVYGLLHNIRLHGHID